MEIRYLLSKHSKPSQWHQNQPQNNKWYYPPQNSTMNHKSTNFKTRINQIIRNQNTLHHFQENFLNIQYNFLDHHIYTDGSKQRMKVACDAIFKNQELLKRLPKESSIYTGEVTAIDQAMNIIANHKSYSKSVLQARQNKNTTPLITRLLDKMNTLSIKKKNGILLIWMPSHIWIHENERADKVAKNTSGRHIQYKNSIHWPKTNQQIHT